MYSKFERKNNDLNFFLQINYAHSVHFDKPFKLAETY